MIDLRSDTVTKPSPAMRHAMASAAVGDDVYGEDPSVNALEAFAAQLLGKQAALFVSSGTQSNLLALLTHCGRGDEYIVGQDAHTYKLEGGGAAALGGIQPQPLNVQADATLALADIEAAIKPDNFHFARSALVCLENTYNGVSLDLGYIKSVRALCDARGLRLHLDGARFFNAVVDRNLEAAELAEPFHTVSICLSKGLGAPVGSLLAGSRDFIHSARRWRKMVGGGMRQAGIIAAGGMYALEHHRERLADDHGHAAQIAAVLGAKFGAAAVTHATNMVHLTIAGATYVRLRDHLAADGVRVDRPRWVLHLDVDDADVETICASIEGFTAG